MKKRALLPIILVLLFSFATSPVSMSKIAYADAAPVFLGGVNICPYNENNISLKREDLLIKISEKSGTYDEGDAYVDAKFVFTNTGDKETIKMGFPFGLAKKRGFNQPYLSTAKVKINGKEIIPKHIMSESGEFDPWIYFNVSFEKGETKTVEVSYNIIPAYGMLLYILKTGALWKGPIGILNIEIDFPYNLSNFNLFRVKPEGYAIKGNKILYRFTNYEPQSNIEIEFLPLDFYEKVAPPKAKAEKTNNPDDWFNYAFALFSQNPFNPLGFMPRFVSYYQTNKFGEYTESVLNKAIELQKPGSVNYKILEAIHAAHFTTNKQFDKGYDILSDICENSIDWYLPNKALNIFGSDVESPQNELEASIIARTLEYEIYASVKQNNFEKALKYFDMLQNVANKFPNFSKPHNEISPIPSNEINPKFNSNLRLTALPFKECFIPSVKIKNNTIYAYYTLPCSETAILKGLRTQIIKDYVLQTKFDSAPPYSFVATIILPTNNKEKFTEAKREFTKKLGKIASAPDEYDAGKTYEFLNIYIPKILENISLENGKLKINNECIDCTDAVQAGLKRLKAEEDKISAFGKGPDGNLAENLLIYLKKNEDYFKYAQENPKICFAYESTDTSAPKKSIPLTVILGGIIGILLLIIVVFAVKYGKTQRSKLT